MTNACELSFAVEYDEGKSELTSSLMPRKEIHAAHEWSPSRS